MTFVTFVCFISVCASARTTVFMFNFLSFPIIPALLDSLKPLARSLSALLHQNTHPNGLTQDINTQRHTHGLGSRSMASGDVPGCLQHLGLVVPLCRSRNRKKKKKKTSDRKSERVGATTGGEKIREETMRDVWTGEWSGRDTRQRSGAQRGKEKNR